jgi:uncharacterized protein
MVTKKALEVAKRVPELKPDLKFIEEAAMLHDIGIYLTDEPQIGCQGKEPYIKHITLGSEILEKEGLPRHAKVCARHIGLGISKEEIENNKLPLPKRDFVPLTVEEEIVSFADLFFTKDPKNLERERTIKEIKEYYSQFGEKFVKKFEYWCKKFKEK